MRKTSTPTHIDKGGYQLGSISNNCSFYDPYVQTIVQPAEMVELFQSLYSNLQKASSDCSIQWQNALNHMPVKFPSRKDAQKGKPDGMKIWLKWVTTRIWVMKTVQTKRLARYSRIGHGIYYWCSCVYWIFQQPAKSPQKVGFLTSASCPTEKPLNYSVPKKSFNYSTNEKSFK